jgi:hypothetical protein
LIAAVLAGKGKGLLAVPVLWLVPPLTVLLVKAFRVRDFHVYLLRRKYTLKAN